MFIREFVVPNVPELFRKTVLPISRKSINYFLFPVLNVIPKRKLNSHILENHKFEEWINSFIILDEAKFVLNEIRKFCTDY